MEILFVISLVRELSIIIFISCVFSRKSKRFENRKNYLFLCTKLFEKHFKLLYEKIVVAVVVEKLATLSRLRKYYVKEIFLC